MGATIESGAPYLDSEMWAFALRANRLHLPSKQAHDLDGFFLPASQLGCFLPFLIVRWISHLVFLVRDSETGREGVYPSAKSAYAHSLGLLSRCTELVSDWCGSSATRYLTNLPCRKGASKKPPSVLRSLVSLRAIRSPNLSTMFRRLCTLFPGMGVCSPGKRVTAQTC
jgi:hypothetical protein